MAFNMINMILCRLGFHKPEPWPPFCDGGRYILRCAWCEKMIQMTRKGYYV